MTVLLKNLQNNLVRILRVIKAVENIFHQMKKINNNTNKYSNHNFKRLSNQIFLNSIHQV